MAVEQTSPYRESLLSARKLRALIREAKGKFAADHVARTMRHVAPALLEEDARELAVLLDELASAARARLADSGIAPDQSHDLGTIPKREREHAAHLGAILTFLCVAQQLADDCAGAIDAGREGIAWCAIGGDDWQSAILWRAVADALEKASQWEEQEQASRSAIDAARRSRRVEEIVTSLNELCSHFIVRFQLDEAKQLNDEATALVQQLEEEKGRDRLQAMTLMHTARLEMCGARHGEGIRLLHEALRLVDGETHPVDRALIMSHLGAIYSILQHHRQSIECQHEVVRLAEIAGANLTRGFGYYRLAVAHWGLGELDLVEEMLDKAEQCVPKKTPFLSISIVTKRAQLFADQGRLDEAAALYRWALDNIDEGPIADLQSYCHKSLAEVEMKRERYDEAERHFRHAIEQADQAPTSRSAIVKICLAELLHRQERNDEVLALLDEITVSTAPTKSDRVKVLHMRASIAERQGALSEALALEREAYTMQCALLESLAEESLRNARIVAETALLEREADLERERRRRVERDLAEAVVQLGDRERLVEKVSERLHTALVRAGIEQGQSIVGVLRETLTELRLESAASSSPLHYLQSVDEEFYRRLRARYSGLSPKQERLCGLLRAGLTSAEIAKLLGLTPEGLRTQRKRLRKKLELCEEDRLETVLAEI